VKTTLARLKLIQSPPFARVRPTFQAELSFHDGTLFCAVNQSVASVNMNLADFAASFEVGDVGHCQP
jgi:hypothetical protein